MKASSRRILWLFLLSSWSYGYGQCIELDLSFPPGPMYNSFHPVVKNQQLYSKQSELIRVEPNSEIVYDAYFYQRQDNWSRPYWLHKQSPRWVMMFF